MSVLEKAASAVNERGKAYGPAGAVHATAARLWSAILGREVTALEVFLCLDALKTARLVHAPYHEDSVVDKAGYAELYGRVIENIPEDARG